MSYSDAQLNPRGRFWAILGQIQPSNNNKTYMLGIAAVLALATAVFLSLMFTAGPWAGENDPVSISKSTTFGAGSEGGVVPAPSGFGGDSALSVTVTDEAFNGGQGGQIFAGAEEPAFIPGNPPSPMVTNASDQRQIISQGSMSVEVADVPTAAARVRAIAEGAGGFVEQLSSHGVAEFQQSTITLRVPQAEFFSVFEQIKALGEVQNENASSDDVTEQFIDLEARLNSARREELSLLSLLDRAEKISEILIIEQELSRVRSEIERLQGQLNFLERRVDLATISVFLSPPQKDNGQAPSGSLTIGSSDVGASVATIKAVVVQVEGEVDRVFTSIEDGRQSALMTVRVFAKDFELLVAAVEDQGGLVSKKISEGKAGNGDAEEPGSRLDIAFQEKESSTLGRNLAIFTPLGGVGLIAVLGFMFYGVYRMGVRRED